MKIDEIIITITALVLLLFFVKALFVLGECHDIGGEYKDGVCIIVLKSNGSVNKVRK